MHFSLVNPYIRVAMESKIASGHHIARRVIYDYELIYLERGQFTLIYDGVPYLCTGGDILFLRPGIPHSFRLDHGDISQPHIHFDITYRPQSEKIPVSFKDADQMSVEERGWIHRDYFAHYPPSPRIRIKNKTQFLEYFYQLVGRKDEPDLIKKALLIQLISQLIENNFPDGVREQSGFCVEKQIRDYIDGGNGFGMTLDDFADAFYYNKFYLEKKFRQAFGIGLIEYRNRKRMEVARDLLREHSVSEVSEFLFYQSIYSFSRAYKKHFGHPPSRQRHP